MNPANISTDSSIAHAVPLEERIHIPDNEPAPLEHQQGHIAIDAGAIDYNLSEVLQMPYLKGIGHEKEAHLRIAYFPSGFTVSTVLSRDLKEVSDPDGMLHETRPEKTALHIEFCDAAYGGTFHGKQRRMPSTRRKFAMFAAEEIRDVLARLPNFPYTLDQVKVLSVDIRSRGTVQPRIFVTAASDVDSEEQAELTV